MKVVRPKVHPHGEPSPAKALMRVGLSPMEREPLLDDVAAESPPWSTEPGEHGSADCGWCHRAIYLPALPCSVRPIAGLAAMPTVQGQGKRCQWELHTRVPRAGQEQDRASRSRAGPIGWAAMQERGA